MRNGDGVGRQRSSLIQKCGVVRQLNRLLFCLFLFYTASLLIFSAAFAPASCTNKRFWVHLLTRFCRHMYKHRTCR